jgi:hypothetical protein
MNKLNAKKVWQQPWFVKGAPAELKKKKKLKLKTHT